MRIYQPPQTLAGFHAEQPCVELPELVHLGEQWLPADRRIGDHRHDTWEFYLQLDGETSWQLPARIVTLAKGDFLGVPPGLRHGMEERPGAAHHFFFVALDIGPGLARHPELRQRWPGDEPIVLRRAEDLRPAFRELMREARLDLPLTALGLRTAIDRLLLECCRAVTATPAQAHLSLHPAVEQARRLIEQDSARTWKLAELAAAVGLSPNHLATIFKREIGVAPHRYLLQQRIEQAKAILRDTDCTITDLATSLGFSSGQHFARVFQQATGLSASAWRKRFQS